MSRWRVKPRELGRWNSEQITAHLSGPPDLIATTDVADGTCRAVMGMHAVRGSGYELRALNLEMVDGAPELTSVMLRSFPLGEWMQAAGETALTKWVKSEHGNLTQTFNHIRDLAAKAGGRLHPTDDVLELVAITYEFCQVLRLPPIKNLQALFSIPNRTASHWVRLAKERGQLEDV